MKVKNCPFCGSEPNIDDPDFCYPATRDRKVWQACCPMCEAQMLGETKEDAINNWNKRYETTKTDK